LYIWVVLKVCTNIRLFVVAVVVQADACHAYQIVHKNGIPEEQIVVMMYDDLANNEKWVFFVLFCF